MNVSGSIMRVIVLSMCLLGAAGVEAEIPVVINEFLASNGEYMADPQGQYDDWVELHNLGAEPVDVGGLYLTDNLAVLAKWQIPPDKPVLTTIPAGGFLLIWADNDLGDPGLHASFLLSAGGEELALVDADGVTLIDSIRFGQQITDVSYGRFPDGSDTWSQMMFPTPGGPNIRVFQGVVAEPRISPDHGFCDGPITATIACETPDVTIYYTTDGSSPYTWNSSRPSASAVVYQEPFQISRTTCLRATAVKLGWRPSPIETRTYIFVEDVIHQSPNGEPPGPAWPSGSVNGQRIDYGMDPDVVNDARYKDRVDDALLAVPSISLVTDLGNLFDSQSGIYVNARSQGQAWERPTSVELLYPDGTEGFQVDAGLRIRGGYSRSGGNPKHAFRLFFRTEYGMSRLRYPLFGDEGVDEFENIDLRTSHNYSWSFEGGNRETFVREVFSRDTQRDMERPYTRSRYYHLYINGHYWGLFQTQERSEASYAETYFGDAKENYDVIKSRAGNGGYDIEATDGNLEAWRELWEATGAGFDNDEIYYRVQGLNPDGTPNPQVPKLLDIDNLIDYMLCTYYVGDPDGPVSAWARVANNFYAIYNRVRPDGFVFFRHDAEHSLYDVYESRLFAPTTLAVGSRFNQSNPLWLHTHLIVHPEYRMRFADRLYKYFFNDGLLTPEPCIDRFMARAAEIDTAIIAESARWGDAKRSRPRTRDDDWLPDINGMVANYFPRRTGIVLDQFKGQGWYPSVNPPTFSRAGGYVPRAATLEMEASGDIYYTLDGTDPRRPEKPTDTVATHELVALNAPKRVFVATSDIGDAWKNDEAFDDSSWRLVTGGPGGVGYERSSGYQSLLSLDVMDQMYGEATGCYLRVPFTLDRDPAEFNVMVLNVGYDDGFVAYLNGVEIERILFNGTPRWDSAALGNHEADAAEPFFVSEHTNLLRQGDNILAIHAMNVSRTSSDFIIQASLEAGESTVPEGGGATETATKYGDPVVLQRSTCVKARVLSGRTWSALNEAVFAVGPVAESLRISEIMYHPADAGSPDDPNTEYVELTNVGTETVDLNLVKFTNGIDFTFANFELAPGDYCLVVKDVTAFEGKYGAGFNIAGQYSGSLNNAGERIELRDAVGAVIHDFRFEDGWFDITDGLGFSLAVKDPTTDPNGFDGKRAWRPSANIGGSPGYDDTGEVPELGSVVINELLANSVAGEPDWIELHNTTNQAIDLGGWFLSDAADDLTKYEIAAGIVLPAGGYLVFDQDHHFGNVGDPGCHERFALSRDGETVYLHSGTQSELTGYSEQERFDASDPDVSLGRHLKSTGTYNFVALSAPTPGAANAAPQVGPVVITEIMYHPAAVADAEYVELLNISDAPVTLYDEVRDAPWRFTDDPDDPGIEFLFPTDPPVTLAPGEYLILAKDADLLAANYAVPANVQVFAWGAGSLANGSEKIQLSKPGDEEDDDTRHWLRVDRVVYSDGSRPNDFLAGADPWPTNPDGHGSVLTRVDPAAYGNDPANWQAAPPSPGSDAR